MSLSGGALKSWVHVPGVQPRLMMDEFFECESAVKSSPEFQEALRKRSIDDTSLVMVDPWPAGNYGVAEEEGLRLSSPAAGSRPAPTTTGTPAPIEGVIAVVDLNEMRVLRVEDHGVVPVPPNDGNYAEEFVKEFRTDLKPLDVVQPEGPSFSVEGNLVSWQKWELQGRLHPARGPGAAWHRL